MQEDEVETRNEEEKCEQRKVEEVKREGEMEREKIE
jgi:hypothetical protein